MSFSDNMVIEKYNSISEFLKYIKNNPVKQGRTRADSQATDMTSWYGTGTYEEAVELLHKGCPDIAKRLEGTLKQDGKKSSNQNVRNVAINSVAGFQASVPRFLNGMPDSMINTKRVVHKEKVVNVIKQVSFLAGTSKQEVEDVALECLEFIQDIERKGQRVNLWIIRGNRCDGQDNACMVKIKGANERLNVSKVAFPIAHVSMLRRLMFSWMERCPEIKSNTSYGRSWTNRELEEFCEQQQHGKGQWKIFGNNL